MEDKGEKIQKAIMDLMTATREVYGDEIAVTVGLDMVLRPNTRTDITGTTISDIMRLNQQKDRKSVV